jgi:hypothetical protein
MSDLFLTLSTVILIGNQKLLRRLSEEDILESRHPSETNEYRKLALFSLIIIVVVVVVVTSMRTLWLFYCLFFVLFCFVLFCFVWEGVATETIS